MTDRAYIISRMLETKIAMAENNGNNVMIVTIDVLKEILTMLKEHEPVRVGKKIKAGDVVLDFYQCGHCKNAIRQPWRYCPFCGKAVKWK